MTPPAVPSPEVYAAVATRRSQFDNLVWQVPVLSITAQAFLFTISLGPDTRPLGRVITCLLSLVVTFLTLQIFTRHRQAEITDAHWLEDYEQRHGISPGGHGLYWRNLREGTSAGAGVFSGFARLRGFVTWAVGLSLFGLASVVILVVTLVEPALLQK